MDWEMKTKPSECGEERVGSDRKYVSQYAEQFAGSTTLHGAQYIIGSQKHHLRRFVWLLIVITCMTWATFTIHGMIVKYRKYESTTKSTVHYNKSIIFPAVTFCNLNQWRRSGSNELTIAMVAAIYGYNDTLREQFDWDSFYKARDLIGEWNLTASALHPVYGAASLKEMLLECYWNGGEKCDESDFDRVLTDFGVCYTFNNPSKTGAVRTINKPGTVNGLTMTLDIIHDEYIVGEFQGAGIKVALHTPGDRPLLKESGFKISTGFETLVSVKETKNFALPDPFESNCTDGIGSLKYNDVYTVPLCLYECKVDHVVEKCGCKDYRYPKESSNKLCKPDDMLMCTIPAEKNASGISCNDCLIPCSTDVFEGRLSSSYWPSYPVKDDLIKAYPKRFNSTESVRNNLLRMTIYFESLSYIQVEEIESYSFSSLEGDIGGTLGLLCGMSIITVVEFIDFFCVLFFKLFESNRKEVNKI